MNTKTTQALLQELLELNPELEQALLDHFQIGESK